MDITLKSDDLARELSLLEKIVSRKPTIAILSNVLVVAEGDSITLSATDLELTLRSKCAASVAKGGIATLPARKLFELVRAMPGAELRLRVLDTGAIKLTGGEFDSRLQSLPADDYPKLTDMQDESVVLPRSGLRRLVKQVRFAMTEGDQRYMLNGAQMSFDGQTITLVATDGHRLAKASTMTTAPKADSVIIPGKALDQLSAMLAEDTESDDVFYVRQVNHMFFKIDDRIMSTTLMEAQFPAWQKMVPKASANEMSLSRSAFATSLRRVLLVSTERIKGVNINADKKAGFVIDTSSHEYGDAKEKVAATITGKGTLKTRCNGQYLLDFLDAAVSESITIDAKDDVTQIMLTDGADYIYIVMPIRA